MNWSHGSGSDLFLLERTTKAFLWYHYSSQWTTPCSLGWIEDRHSVPPIEQLTRAWHQNNFLSKKRQSQRRYSLSRQHYFHFKGDYNRLIEHQYTTKRRRKINNYKTARRQPRVGAGATDKICLFYPDSYFAINTNYLLGTISDKYRNYFFFGDRAWVVTRVDRVLLINMHSTEATLV